jgi:transposase-like protein
MNAITIPVPVPETEVPERPERRRFTAEYKRKILREAARCTKPGEIGALLRREGLHSSYLSNWRRASERAELKALAPKARGPKKQIADSRDKKITDLEREKARLEARLVQAEAVIALQKKVSHLLGLVLPENSGNLS